MPAHIVPGPNSDTHVLYYPDGRVVERNVYTGTLNALIALPDETQLNEAKVTVGAGR